MNHLLKVSEAICTFRIFFVVDFGIESSYFFSCEQTKTMCAINMLENDVQNLTTTKTSDVDENDLSEDDSEEEESLGKVLTKNGKEIDRKSAGNVKRSKEEIKADDEPENEFGYTDSEWNLFWL